MIILKHEILKNHKYKFIIWKKAKINVRNIIDIINLVLLWYQPQHYEKPPQYYEKPTTT